MGNSELLRFKWPPSGRTYFSFVLPGLKVLEIGCGVGTFEAFSLGLRVLEWSLIKSLLLSFSIYFVSFN